MSLSFIMFLTARRGIPKSSFGGDRQVIEHARVEQLPDKVETKNYYATRIRSSKAGPPLVGSP